MLFNKIALSGITSSFWLTTVGVCQAQVLQVIEDDTLPPTQSTQVSKTLEGLGEFNFTIRGGVRANSNLFHSFEQFSIPIGGSASFDNPLDITNIFSRVTGGDTSNIDGMIRAQGKADLFLINPSGIVFGPNASLELSGSFMASTAEAIQFADGSSFSAINIQEQPIFSVRVPAGLQFGSRPGNISSQAQLEFTDSLNRTIALVGGNILFSQGSLSVSKGNIEIGSFAPNSTIRFIQTDGGFNVVYDTVQSYQNIQLENGFLGGSNIQLREGRVNITDGAVISGSSVNIIVSDVNTIFSDSVEIRNGGTLDTLGTTGDISIQAESLIIDNGSLLADTALNEPGGNITLDISNSIELSNSGEIANATVDGPAGMIEIHTSMLTVRDGGQINSSTSGLGSAGRLVVHAAESIILDGAEGSLTGLFVISEEGSEGAAGKLEITTGDLLVQNGAQISAETRSLGDGGGITINADLLELSSTSTASGPSGLFTLTSSSGDGGDVRIETDRLIIQDGATISAESIDAIGDAGDLDIRARSVILNNQGSLTTSTDKTDGGNITLNLGDVLLLRNGGEISTSAGREGAGGDGGDININTANGVIIAIPNEDSNIAANSFDERAGNITIRRPRFIYGFTVLNREDLRTLLGNVDLTDFDTENLPTSDITAISLRGTDVIQGTVDIDTLGLDPSQGLAELPDEPVDVNRLIARGCAGGVRTSTTESEFFIRGRDGVPSGPDQPLPGGNILDDIDTQILDADGESATVSSSAQSLAPSETIVEANRWFVDTDGVVVFTAQPVSSNSSQAATAEVCSVPDISSVIPQ